MKIAIAGFGLMGKTLALELLSRKNNFDITIFDYNKTSENKQCSEIAAAMLSPFAELEISNDLVFNLGAESLKKWGEIKTQLKNQFNYYQTGSLFVAHRQDMGEFERVIGLINAKINDSNLGSKIDKAEILNKTQIQKLESELDNFEKASFFKQDGHIENTDFILSSSKYLSAKTKIINKKVDEIIENTIKTSDKNHIFDFVFDCRGLGANKDIKNLRGVRGEVIRLHAPEVNILRPIRFMHPKYKIYVAPKKNDIYVVGATEIESCDMSKVSLRSSMELMSAAYSLHSGFGDSRIISMDTNCRPTTIDNNPAIFYSKNLIRINGLYRHGFLLSPALAKRAVDVFMDKAKDDFINSQLIKNL
jgi:glycine oxidase